MEWMLLPFKRYADFQGRSRRKEYWMFALFLFIIGIAFGILSSIFAPTAMPVGPDGMPDPTAAPAMSGGMSFMLILLGIFYLAILIPSIAVTVRRLHDQDKSGWMVLLGLIPLVGGLILFIFMLLEGTRGPNRFGPDPKEVDPV